MSAPSAWLRPSLTVGDSAVLTHCSQTFVFASDVLLPETSLVSSGVVLVSRPDI